jgi:hypothetical protein
VLAFYWDGGMPTPHSVPDISPTGIYVKTDDRWTPSSLIRVTLQMQSEDPEKADESITVQCRVVRTGEDGVGMAIVLAEEDQSEFPGALGSLATRRQLNKFLEHLLAEMPQQPPDDSPYLPFPDLEQTAEPANPSAEHDPQQNK